MNIIIDYSTLSLIDYEGAGNRTPVLCLDSITDISKYDIASVRSFLEQDSVFRAWLQEQGCVHNADSVMIYYTSPQSEYEYVTFIGEPGAALDQPFSDMCGNGIRSLALHIFLEHEASRERFLAEGIRIYAGSVRTISFNSVDVGAQHAMVQVNLGPFRNEEAVLAPFLQVSIPETLRQVTQIFPCIQRVDAIGIGLNGDETGEPHLSLIIDQKDVEQIMRQLEIPMSGDIVLCMRQIACVMGNRLTFDTSLFPVGINVNVGCVVGDALYMSTHERNMLPSQAICASQQAEKGFCHCNTLACGTGGSVTANIATASGFFSLGEVRTVQPGGMVAYSLSGKESIMVGPARRV